MRFDAIGWTVRLLTPVLLLCGLVATDVMAQPPGGMPDPPRNSAVLNKPFKQMGSDQGSWVWRDRKIQPPGDGFEGIVAYVTERKKKGGGTNPDHATLRIWLYDAVPDEVIENTFNLQLSEKYAVHLTEMNEANSEGKANRSFHFIVTMPINGADGLADPDRVGTRTFLLTGTRERGRGNSRTLRITTFTTSSAPEVEPTPAPVLDSTSPLRSVARTVASAPCSDYPDDAVLEEMQYSATSEFPAESNPDSGSDWMTYSLPEP